MSEKVMSDCKLIHLSETASTNSWLRNNGTQDDCVVWTDYQTAGRGCGTNSWESERAKNLLFSVLIHPKEVRAADQFILSMANALALRDTLACYLEETEGTTETHAGEWLKIKWPNDIYWKDCKICGTLIETTLKGPYVKDCIIGTGLNVNQTRFVSDAPNPVSLRQILEQQKDTDERGFSDHDIDRHEVLQKVLDHFAAYMKMVEAGQWEAIRTSYRRHLYRREERHPYRFTDGTVKTCKLINVSDDGHLELLHDGGEVCRLAFKEVQFVIPKSRNPEIP